MAFKLLGVLRVRIYIALFSTSLVMTTEEVDDEDDEDEKEEEDEYCCCSAVRKVGLGRWRRRRDAIIILVMVLRGDSVSQLGRRRQGDDEILTRC